MRVVDLRPRRVVSAPPAMLNFGLYVVQFDHCVKIGKAHDLRWRLRSHVLAGASRARVFSMGRSLDVREPTECAERSALYNASAASTRCGRGRSEYFDDLPFDTATSITAAAVLRYGGAESFEADITRLRGLPVQLVPITEREDT